MIIIYRYLAKKYDPPTKQELESHLDLPSQSPPADIFANELSTTINDKAVLNSTT